MAKKIDTVYLVGRGNEKFIVEADLMIVLRDIKVRAEKRRIFYVHRNHMRMDCITKTSHRYVTRSLLMEGSVANQAAVALVYYDSVPLCTDVTIYVAEFTVRRK